MFLRKHTCAILSILLIGSFLPISVLGQRTSYAPPKSVEQMRQVDHLRLWTFTHKGKDFGRLISKVDGTERIDGRMATVVFDSLDLDFPKIGTGSALKVWGKQYISSIGTYLGSDLNLPNKDRVEELSLRANADPDRKTITGYFTRDGRKLNQSVTISRDMFGWDVHLLDQLELWLAMQPFSVGDTLQDTLFSPQSMVTVPIYGVVDQFMNREIYQNKFDSVFVVELEQPQPLQLTFSPRRELVRVDFIGQDIRAYLDYVGPIATEKTTSSASNPGMSGTTVMRWILFLLMGGLTLIVLAIKGIRWSGTWIALLGGLVIGVILLLIMTPLQTWLVQSLLSDSTMSVSVVYLWIVPALVLALVQEIFKAFGIYSVVWWRNPKEYLMLSVGAALGIGIGLCESAYQTWNFQISTVIDWTLLGHLFMIMFHGVAGGMVGWSLLKGKRTLSIVVILNILLNGLIHYLPGLIVTGSLDLPLVHLTRSLIATLYLLVAIMICRKQP